MEQEPIAIGNIAGPMAEVDHLGSSAGEEHISCTAASTSINPRGEPKDVLGAPMDNMMDDPTDIIGCFYSSLQ